MIGLIHSVWPNLNIVCEESSNLRATFTLDATAEFAKGFLDPVMILIGIAVNERLYAGIASYVFKHDNY
ncbi:MAG: hypothetical protein EZS28_003253 [Streblomastix strix]|uniref:Uncharacterized protein n=1 Tax=Streblomastix strix TaxID=222440 RepID=A0A5J4X395_9EUKA|nr:MAG: hypothetical protein EZS28_003253 [Streblomastix strix]